MWSIPNRSFSVISSIIDVVLLAALGATSGSVLMMYRRLQRFDALQGEAAKEFARASDALDKARDALAKLQADGGDMTVTLASRLNEARVVINDIEEATSQGRAALPPHQNGGVHRGADMSRSQAPAPRRGPRVATAEDAPGVSGEPPSPAHAPSAHCPDHRHQTTEAHDGFAVSSTFDERAGGVCEAHGSALGQEAHSAPSRASMHRTPLQPDHSVAAAETPFAPGNGAAASGSPTAVARIRAAARGGRGAHGDRAGSSSSGEPWSGPEARSRVCEQDMAAQAIPDEKSARPAAATQAAAQPQTIAATQAGTGRAPSSAPQAASDDARWMPPRTRKTWAKPGAQPAMSRWAAAAIAEGRMEPPDGGPAAVDWRKVARPAAAGAG